MSNSIYKLVMVMALLMLSACTNLKVNQLTADSKVPIKGLSYNLPFMQYELQVTRTLTQCPTDENQNTVKYKTDVAVVSATSEPDSSQEYNIDLEGLANFWKISDLKVTISGGILQQINASASDQTAQVVQNLATSVGTIVTSIATNGIVPAAPKPVAPAIEGKPSAPVAPPPAPAIKMTCNPKVIDALQKLGPDDPQEDDNITNKPKTLNKQLKDATDILSADTAALKALTGVASSLGTKLDPKIQDQIFEKTKQIIVDTKKQADIQKQVTDYQKLLTQSKTFRWPLSGVVDNDGNNPYQEITLPGGKEAISAFLSDFEPKDDYFVVGLRLQRLPGSELVPISVTSEGQSNKCWFGHSCTPHNAEGIRYRVPARGQLILCKRDDFKEVKSAPTSVGNAASNGNDSNITPVSENTPESLRACSALPAVSKTLPATSDAIWEGPVAQLGRIQFLPYKNKMFQNNLLSATFNNDGTLATAEYQDVASRAATASNLLSQISTLAAQTRGTIVAAPTTKIAAETAKITAENTQIQAQNTLFSTKAAATTAQQTAMAQANTTLATALKAQIDAQTALQSVQPKSSTTP